MPRYFFHIDNNGEFPDNDGTVLDDAATARAEAIMTAGAMLKESGGRVEDGIEWRMTVVDEAGQAVCELHFSAQLHRIAALRGATTPCAAAGTARRRRRRAAGPWRSRAGARRSPGSLSQRGTAAFSTPPLIRPCPVMTSTTRRPIARDPATNPFSARCASACVIPCRSRRASIGIAAAPQPLGAGAVETGEGVERRRWHEARRVRSRRLGGDGVIYPKRLRLAGIHPRPCLPAIPGSSPGRGGSREGVLGPAAQRDYVPHRPPPQADIVRRQPHHLPAPRPPATPPSTSTTCSRRGPCAPSWMRCSISPVRDGPVIRLTVRGQARGSPLRPGAHQVPGVLVTGDDLPGAQDDDMRIRQEIERRRRVLPRYQHQRPGLGDRREARGQRHRVARFGPPAPDPQQRPLMPRDRVETGIGRHDQFGRQVLGRQIARHLGRNLRLGRNARDGGLHLLGHRDEQLDPSRVVERGGARRDQIAAMPGDALGQRRSAFLAAADRAAARGGRRRVCRRARP